ncbi:exodeoxyribonuclease VII large subunit [Achromobacter sp. GG226]|uniref:exodeoxyribonuclease VII large subunit n=1 Tax=Verticiella alkaliphila TaxID=2779529 RepID=UPI001C0B3D80|nr:exodeoxyribonuclease VII large subunit [Verticiella sp. GG226]MBU4609217.1 exodeoxyribonuclease VII large subunit [Verticiella sp. GG226]
MNAGSALGSAPNDAPLTVTQLNRAVAGMLEQAVPPVWVRGEVSNFLSAASGHWYFTLKDAGASVRAVMFRMKATQVGFVPRAGDRVEVRAKVSLYEARGDYQLQVQAMRRAGQGDLFEAFLRLKEKLEAEGLLSPERKRAPVELPRALGVVTSLHAAALRDVLTALARRLPHVHVHVYPTPVQGADAPPAIVRAIETANRRADVDTLLLVRGGGSIEDLWAFNDERVARAVAASALPVICGVGHESDFTIADFVADVRAPTPTAAAELAGTPREQLLQSVMHLAQGLRRAQSRRLEQLAQRLDRSAARLVSPAQRLTRQQDRLTALQAALQRAQALRLERAHQRVARLADRIVSPAQTVQWQQARVAGLATALGQAQGRRLERLAQRVKSAGAHLRVLGPQETLARGYAIARDEEGRIIRDASALRAGQGLSVSFAQGNADVRVERTSDAAGSAQ